MEFFSLPCSSERVNPFWFIPEQPSSSAPVRACWLGVQKISRLWGWAVVFHLASKLNWKRKFLFFLKREKITMLCKGIRLTWSSRECQHAEFQVKTWLFSKALFSSTEHVVKEVFYRDKYSLKSSAVAWLGSSLWSYIKAFFGCLNHCITTVARNGSSHPWLPADLQG